MNTNTACDKSYNNKCRLSEVSAAIVLTKESMELGSLNPDQKRLLRCVEGYARIECNIEYLVYAIARMISKFWNSLYGRYLQVLCSKAPHKLSSPNPFLEINLKYFISNIFNTSQCGNCFNTECLQFTRSYQQSIFDDETGSIDNAFKNIRGNEYECELCGYYTLLNVNAYIKYYHRKNYTDCKYLYVTPIKSIMKGVKAAVDHLEEVVCGECGSKFVDMFDIYADYSQYSVYCTICDLFTHKLD